MPIEPGTRLGAYEVQDLLGSGAMGTVYRAHHAGLARTAAVKVLHALAPDPDATARFRHEAQAIARMRHPNVVNVYDFGEHEGTPYMVVEYVPGGSLNDRMKGGQRLTDPEALRLLDGIAAALDYAHGLDIVHRDVKPANVLLDQNASAVLADFGLAKLLQNSSVKTISGVTTGTPAYMSPEQVMGASVGPAADEYALATMAYELMAGDVPFAGEGVLELLYAHVHREPPLASSRRPDLAAGVDAVLARGLAKDPAARWESCTALVAALRQALDKKAVEATLPMPPQAAAPDTRQAAAAAFAPRRRRRPWRIAAVAGLILVVVAAGLLLLADRQRPGAARVAVNPGTVRAGTTLRLSASGLPAGSAFAQLTGGGRTTLLATDLDTNSGGSWSATVTIPSSVAPGAYQVRVCKQPAPGTNCATTALRVTR